MSEAKPIPTIFGGRIPICYDSTNTDFLEGSDRTTSISNLVHAEICSALYTYAAETPPAYACNHSVAIVGIQERMNCSNPYRFLIMLYYLSNLPIHGICKLVVKLAIIKKKGWQSVTRQPAARKTDKGTIQLFASQLSKERLTSSTC